MFQPSDNDEKINLEKDLEFCEKHGYEQIEIRTTDKLKDYLENHTIEELANYFKTSRIKPYAFNALEFLIIGMKLAIRK